MHREKEMLWIEVRKPSVRVFSNRGSFESVSESIRVSSYSLSKWLHDWMYRFYSPQVTALHTATEFNGHWSDFTRCISLASRNLSILSIFSRWPLISGRIGKRLLFCVWPVTLLTVTSACHLPFCTSDLITSVISLRIFLMKWNSVFDIWTSTRKS